jgi:RimJ/RimL family protein N-acetyltransferase
MSQSFSISLPVLKTQRLILRPFKLSDSFEAAKLAGERLVSLTTGSLPHPYTAEMASHWITEHQKYLVEGTQAIFALENLFENNLVGCVSLHIDLAQPHRAELGYWIGKMFWGLGFATEAAGAVLHFGFSELNKEKIFARHFGMNPASGKVLTKIGMKPEGVLREHFVRWGVPHDIHHYSLLRSEWENKN